MKPYLLFLSAYLPSPSAPQAGQKTAFRHLRWLSEHYDISLMAFRNEAELNVSCSELDAICCEVHLFTVTQQTRIAGACRKPGAPLLVSARWHTGFRTKLHEIRERHEFARVHCEWSQMGQYLDIVYSIPQRTLYVHDVISQWAQRRSIQKHSWFWRFEAWRSQKWESATYPKLTRIYVPSKKDAQLIALKSPMSHLEILPLCINFYGPNIPRDFNQNLRLLFWGSLGRIENAEAARWLCADLLPCLRRSNVPFTLVLAGSNPPPDLQQYRGVDVEITGFMDDPSPEFARSHLAVLPLFEGAGVKVKVLECLAAGLPVLTTEIGAEGIDANSSNGLFILPDKAETFCDCITDLVKDRVKLADLSRATLSWGQNLKADYKDVLFR
jgi:glycosyltransferase involved in cell wall biosynthesis